MRVVFSPNVINFHPRYEELKQQINAHNYRYHVLDAPVISDLEFDRLLNGYKQIEADHPDWITADSPTRRTVDPPVRDGRPSPSRESTW